MVKPEKSVPSTLPEIVFQISENKERGPMKEMKSTSRREFLWKAGAFVATVAGANAIEWPAFAGSKLRRPNILMIVNDEERHWSMTENLIDSNRLGSEINPAQGTFHSLIPGRMRLRNNGVRFSNYYTPTAPCSPARSVLYTGHHAPDTQVVDNMDFEAQTSMSAKIPTMADVMGAAGYYCAYKGKVHLAKDEDMDSAADMRARYGFRDWEGPFRTGDNEGPLSGAMRDDNIERNAREWLAGTGKKINKKNQPWLLAVNFINPHDVMLVDIDGDGETQFPQGEGTTRFPLSHVPDRDPYYYWWNPQKPANFSGENGYTVETSGPRPQILDEFASLLSALFGNIPLDDSVTTTISVYTDNADPGRGIQQISVPLWQAYLNYYLNCIIDNDRAIKGILDALTANALADSTIVLLLADHGEMAMSHMGASRYFDEAAVEGYEEPNDPAQSTVMPLRQKGPLLYQENLNLPMVVANLSTNSGALVNQYVPSNKVDTPVLASSVDLLPTFLTWAGKSLSWYNNKYGRTTSKLGMRANLPGVPLINVIKDPFGYTTPKWSDGSNGRDWVLFTADTLTTADADYAYLVAWGQCSGKSIDFGKRGILRGIYDGESKYGRYFSPLEYQLNSAEFSNLEYDALIAAGTYGQDVQLFDRTADPSETLNTADGSSSPVAELNQTLYQAMQRELASATRVPNTVQTIIDGKSDSCA